MLVVDRINSASDMGSVLCLQVEGEGRHASSKPASRRKMERASEAIVLPKSVPTSDESVSVGALEAPVKPIDISHLVRPPIRGIGAKWRRSFSGEDVGEKPGKVARVDDRSHADRPPLEENSASRERKVDETVQTLHGSSDAISLRLLNTPNFPALDDKAAEDAGTSNTGCEGAVEAEQTTLPESLETFAVGLSAAGTIYPDTDTAEHQRSRETPEMRPEMAIAEMESAVSAGPREPIGEHCDVGARPDIPISTTDFSALSDIEDDHRREIRNLINALTTRVDDSAAFCGQGFTLP
jgi:hypothetical protein